MIGIDRERDAIDRDKVLAWRTANLYRAKEFPSLTKYLGRKDKPQTFEQQRNTLHMLSKMYGGPVKQVDA